VSAADAVASVRSGEHVFIGSGAAEPTELSDALTARADELLDVKVFHIYTLGTAPYTAPELERSFRHVAFFVGSNVRQAVHEGRADFVPVHLHQVPSLFQRVYPLDWAFVQLSPPDRHGWCTAGVSADVVMGAIRNARHVVAEINPAMPRSLGNTGVHVSSLHSFVEVDRPLPEVAPIEPNDTVERIGANVAELIRDGDCLQLGIGGIPNSVLAQLRDHRHLGIHTEALTDGVVDLYEAGAITNERKSIKRFRSVCSFALGTRRLYDFVDDNLAVSMHGAEYVNDPEVIARNEDVVAVNSAIEVDLTGQVDADSIGVSVYSGIGGQVDFIRGAAESRGGRPVIALQSTARGGTVSRIVPTLTPGAGVVTTRGDVRFVVTEWGVADLFGSPMHQRATDLIGIAHPDMRDDLERQARDLGLLRSRSF
jgi:acetyl-CoA hydrolase